MIARVVEDIAALNFPMDRQELSGHATAFGNKSEERDLHMEMCMEEEHAVVYCTATSSPKSRPPTRNPCQSRSTYRTRPPITFHPEPRGGFGMVAGEKSKLHGEQHCTLSPTTPVRRCIRVCYKTYCTVTIIMGKTSEQRLRVFRFTCPRLLLNTSLI